MTNIKITDLTAYTDAVSTDVLPIVDVVADVTKKIAIGDIVKAVPQGTAALPGLAFDNDPNTGVYSPGADQVAISTNGVGRLFVDSSGRVGIGAAPDYAFDVSGTITTRNSDSAAFDALQFYATGMAANNKFWRAQITTTDQNWQTVDDAYSVGNTWLKATRNGNQVETISFFTGTSGTSERLRITSDGKLGVGTSSPSSRLSVQGDGTSARTVEIVNPSATNGAHLYLGDSQADASIRTVPVSGVGTNLAFYVNSSSTERMRIDNLGRVGIGSNSPQANLVVSNGGEAGLEINPIGYDSGPILQAFNRSTSAYVPINMYSSYVAFNTGTSAVERARIDSSGRLLVGTSSARSRWYNTGEGVATPLVQLDGTSFSSSSISIARNDSSIASEAPRFLLGRSRGATAGSFTVVQSGDELGSLSFQGADGAEFVEAALIKAEVDGTPGANDMPGRLVFSTTADGASSPTERMRISQDGWVSTYSTGVIAFSVSSSAAAGTSDYLYIGRYGATAVQGGTTSYLVFTNGNVQNTNNSYAAISDIKLKENIVDANSQWADLKALQVRNYNFKEGQTHTQIGLIAQEVELVSPGLVSESPDRDEDGNDLGTVTKSVNYSVLYMKAVKALQEAMERIETLEAKVAALEAQ
jgi:hypothetical protein